MDTYHKTARFYDPAPILVRIDVLLGVMDQRELAAAFGLFRGMKLDSVVTCISRMRKKDQIAEELADDWCLFLGTSLAAMYPEIYLAA